MSRVSRSADRYFQKKYRGEYNSKFFVVLKPRFFITNHGALKHNLQRSLQEDLHLCSRTGDIGVPFRADV
ncbi:hypothetical protein GE061_006048 [Apolygus lucorum]|uniref:Uncharacterized protein n=1 Tax=Apolygus lucorum TaxID=248454 RepID=A0A6A4JEX9_APOLU|nr:hypothetical protein GE061_006048 [Apolygus lucorum]